MPRSRLDDPVTDYDESVPLKKVWAPGWSAHQNWHSVERRWLERPQVYFLDDGDSGIRLGWVLYPGGWWHWLLPLK